jgi:hypothetical protein
MAGRIAAMLGRAVQPGHLETMTQLSASLARSPEWFPQALDPRSDSVSLIRLTEADYAKASFLDGRNNGFRAVQTLPFGEVRQGADGLPEACDYIFHIGHVGSTLLSRLLGAHPAVFALREPAILRTLAQIRAESFWAEANVEAHLSTFLALWSRTFRPEQRAQIKATSFASELASPILSRASQPKAIFMFVPPQDFLASILGAENSPREAHAMAPSRAARLNKRLGTNIRAETLSIGEMTALGWACEMTALTAAPQKRVLWLDFQRFLAAPPTALAACFAHLGIAATAEQIKTIASSPDTRRYSKAPEFDYDAQLRADILAQARVQCGPQIKRGMDWLEKAAGVYPAIAAALQIFGAG